MPACTPWALLTGPWPASWRSGLPDVAASRRAALGAFVGSAISVRDASAGSDYSYAYPRCVPVLLSLHLLVRPPCCFGLSLLFSTVLGEAQAQTSAPEPILFLGIQRSSNTDRVGSDLVREYLVDRGELLLKNVQLAEVDRRCRRQQCLSDLAAGRGGAGALGRCVQHRADAEPARPGAALRSATSRNA